jgi:histidine triad (HIT) family protein
MNGIGLHRIDPDCIFCKIVARRIPAAVVHEDDETLAFMDIGQVNPGHVLVAVKGHAENLFDLSDAQAAAVFRSTAQVARAIRDAFQPPGLTLFQANGKAALQSVFHFHIHVLPRWENDGVGLAWPAKNPARETLAEYASKIKSKLRR